MRSALRRHCLLARVVLFGSDNFPLKCQAVLFTLLSSVLCTKRARNPAHPQGARPIVDGAGQDVVLDMVSHVLGDVVGVQELVAHSDGLPRLLRHPLAERLRLLLQEATGCWSWSWSAAVALGRRLHRLAALQLVVVGARRGREEEAEQGGHDDGEPAAHDLVQVPGLHHSRLRMPPTPTSPRSARGHWLPNLHAGPGNASKIAGRRRTP
mmetsp:Transcript_14960/g.52508  ORF Transcript_14960/g.52508 Transcript_14960/m.52508 type:complete len:210 (-) Transcript_14960:24-653(-)